MKGLRLGVRVFSLISPPQQLFFRQGLHQTSIYLFSEKTKNQDTQKNDQKQEQAQQREQKEEQEKKETQKKQEEKIESLDESHEDKLHRVEQFYSKQIEKFENQIKDQKEKIHDQIKLINQLEASNKDHNSKIKELREALKAEIEEQELQQKRISKEKEQLKVFAISNFAKELLEVQDNLERAIGSTTDKPEDNPLLEGVVMTHSILEKVYKKFGVQKMDIVGKKFDPNFHESLFQVEDPEKEPGSICYVAQDGYVIGERVLRPAKVGVVKQQS
ncbi:unnamed protein product [Paramecium sonneborni]|uniref:GrpE protein homolog n=1 Tax=Paramecium sonneborni TaxID=65129 RepID=A0A8S1JYX3_9CILI|nr:unnamed protein product [Paramecium sonneborni]